MAARLVPLTDRQCVHCGRTYQAKDRRRIYCSSSCNTMAWMARRRDDKPKPPIDPVVSSPDLRLSMANVATIGTSVLVADALKASIHALLDEQPSPAEVMARLERVERLINGLHLKVDAVWQISQATNGSVIDLTQGVGVLNPAVNRAIALARQQRNTLPKAELPFSQAGR